MEWRLEHMGLAARDTSVLAEWYQRALGLRLIKKTTEEPPAYFLQEPGGMILEIVPAKDGREESPTRFTPGWRHAALLTDDFQQTYDRLEAAGVVFEPVIVNGKDRVAFFRDPEGNLLHIIERGQPLE